MAWRCSSDDAVVGRGEGVVDSGGWAVPGSVAMRCAYRRARAFWLRCARATHAAIAEEGVGRRQASVGTRHLNLPLLASPQGGAAHTHTQPSRSMALCDSVAGHARATPTCVGVLV
eukprot:221509-Chlamydomonas_euryale.AAC.4